MCLVDLDHAVNLPHKPETGHETDQARQQKEQKDHDERVAKVQEGRRCVVDGQLCGKVMATIDEQIAGRWAGRQEWPPPPVIILRAQVEIAQQNGGLRARDDQYPEDEE